MNNNNTEGLGDRLLEELEDDMPQGVPNDTKQVEEEDDPFADLNDLLSESMEDVKAREQYQADLKSRKRGFHGMSKEEIDFCNSRMAAFEQARIWQTEFAIGVWALYQCQCGRERMVFSRYMEHQTSRAVKTTKRWVTVPSTTYEATPVKEIRPVETCPRCSEWELDPRLMADLKEVLG